MSQITQCADCGCARGELHELYCTKELCPFCHGQLAACGCIHTVLQLSEEESKVVDEYVDDSVAPLRGIVARWERALQQKGRIALGEDLKILGIEA